MEKNSDWSVISAYDYAVNAIGQRERVDRTGSALRSNATHESVLNYPTYDGNGNVSEYLDFTGTPVAHYQYNAFGNTIDSKTTGAKANDFAHRFSTKPLDTENGFYYYGYRYYNPVTGTWPSRDPIGELGGVNLYSILNNDIISKIDNLGLVECCGGEELKSGYICCEDEQIKKGRGNTHGKKCDCKKAGGRWTTVAECRGGFDQCMEDCLAGLGGWKGAGGVGGALAGWAAAAGAGNLGSFLIGTSAYTGCAAMCGRPTCCMK